MFGAMLHMGQKPTSLRRAMKFSRPACATMYALLSPRCAMFVVSSDEVAVYAAEIVTVRKAMMRIAIGRAKPRRSRSGGESCVGAVERQ